MKRTINHNNVLIVLGTKIQLKRKALGFSQREMADMLGISRVYMGYIEQGRESPSLKLLVDIANVLNLSLTEMFSL